MVEPTQFKKYQSNWIIPPGIGVNINKKMFETTSQIKLDDDMASKKIQGTQQLHGRSGVQFWPTKIAWKAAPPNRLCDDSGGVDLISAIQVQELNRKDLHLLSIGSWDALSVGIYWVLRCVVSSFVAFPACNRGIHEGFIVLYLDPVSTKHWMTMVVTALMGAVFTVTWIVDVEGFFTKIPQ